jgi:hypothetical protein
VQHWSTTIHQNILVSFVIVIISLALVFIYMQVNILFIEERKGKGKEIAPCFLAENMDPPHSKGATPLLSTNKVMQCCGSSLWAPRHPTLVEPRSVGPSEPFSLKIHPSLQIDFSNQRWSFDNCNITVLRINKSEYARADPSSMGNLPNRISTIISLRFLILIINLRF